MYSKMKTRRVKAMAIGALVASVMSVGAAAGTASAEQAADSEAKVVSVKVQADFGVMSMRSGIRW